MSAERSFEIIYPYPFDAAVDNVQVVDVVETPGNLHKLTHGGVSVGAL